MERRRRSTPAGAVGVLRRRVGSARKDKLQSTRAGDTCDEEEEGASGGEHQQQEALQGVDYGAAVELPGGGMCRGEEGVRGLNWWGGAIAGALGSAFIEQGGGEGATARALAINAMAGASGFKTFIKGALDWGEMEGGKGGRVKE
jgi:hypothetical protein